MSSVHLSTVLDMFLSAVASGLENPRIRFTVQGESVELRLPSRRSNNPRSAVHIFSVNNGYLGQILEDALFVPSRQAIARELDRDLTACLSALNANPAQFAKAYAKATAKRREENAPSTGIEATGDCCFCGRQLTDGRSVAHGYGPICAGRFGLPWGEVTAQDVKEWNHEAPYDVPPSGEVGTPRHHRTRSEALEKVGANAAAQPRPEPNRDGLVEHVFRGKSFWTDPKISNEELEKVIGLRGVETGASEVVDVLGGEYVERAGYLIEDAD